MTGGKCRRAGLCPLPYAAARKWRRHAAGVAAAEIHDRDCHIAGFCFADVSLANLPRVRGRQSELSAQRLTLLTRLSFVPGHDAALTAISSGFSSVGIKSVANLIGLSPPSFHLSGNFHVGLPSAATPIVVKKSLSCFSYLSITAIGPTT